MKTKSIVVLATAIATCAVAGLLISKHFAARNVALQPNTQDVNDMAAKAAPLVIKPRAMPLVLETTNAGTSAVENPLAKVENPSANAAPQGKKSSAKEPLKDPVARDALTLVGLDSEAEAYWFAAINDLSLPANERQDLIEDLNEEGLPDPKHPSIDDLPLIFNRLALIEAIGADAADEINADAFMEAYKDLLNLAELAMGGGRPVK